MKLHSRLRKLERFQHMGECPICYGEGKYVVSHIQRGRRPMHPMWAWPQGSV
jgi:hypothetical protein